MNEEKRKNNTLQRLRPSMTFGVAAVICAVITAFCPVLFPLMIALGTQYYALTILFDPTRIICKVIPVLFFVIALLTTNSLTAAVLLLGIFFPAGLALSIAVDRSKPFGSGVAMQFFALCVYLLAVFGAMMLESGVGFDVESLFEPFREALKGSLSEVYALIPKEAAQITYPYLSAAVYTESNFVYTLYTVFTESIPSVLCILLLGASTVSYWRIRNSVHALYRKVALPEEMKFFGSFDLVRMSKTTGTVYVIVSFVCLLSTTMFEAVAFSTFRALLTAVFCYEAVALAAYAMKMYNVPKIARILIYLVLLGIAVFSSSAQTIFALVGLIDCFYDLRRLINPTAYVV